MSTVSHGGSGVGSDFPEPDVRATLELVRRLTALHDVGKTAFEFQKLLATEYPSAGAAGDPVPLARARKVSVSLPEQLTAAVQQRVGKGEFSHYVAEAVARQLELDLLAELSDVLADEHGPVPEEYLAQAAAAWPDAK
ncbi:MAG: HD domain-containing protein, partial [Pseudonocardiaceae bacterium]